MKSAQKGILIVIVIAALFSPRHFASSESDITWDDDDYPRPKHQEWDEGGTGDDEDDIPWENITFTPDMIDKILHVLAENSGRRDPMKVIRAALFPMGFQNDRTLFGDYSRGLWRVKAAPEQKYQDRSTDGGVDGRSGLIGDEEKTSNADKDDNEGTSGGKTRAGGAQEEEHSSDKVGTTTSRGQAVIINGEGFTLRSDGNALGGEGVAQSQEQDETDFEVEEEEEEGSRLFGAVGSGARAFPGGFPRPRPGSKFSRRPLPPPPSTTEPIHTDENGNKYYKSHLEPDDFVSDLQGKFGTDQRDDNAFKMMTQTRLGSGQIFFGEEGCDPVKNNCFLPESVTCMSNSTDSFGKPVYRCMCDYIHTFDPTVAVEDRIKRSPCVSNVWTPCTKGALQLRCGENMDCQPDPIGLDTEKYCVCKKGFAPSPNEYGIIALCRPLAHHELDEEEGEDYSQTGTSGSGLNAQWAYSVLAQVIYLVLSIVSW